MNIRRFSNFWSRTDGSVPIYVALAGIPIMGLTAGAIQLGAVMLEQGKLQTAADVAAMSAGNQYVRSESEDDAKKAAARALDLSNVDFSEKDLYDDFEVKIVGGGTKILLKVRPSKPSAAAKALGIDLEKQSGVIIIGESSIKRPCILALSEDADKSVEVNGGPTSPLNLGNCGIYSNSGSDKSIVINGNPSVIAECVDARKGNNGTAGIVFNGGGEPKEGCTQIDTSTDTLEASVESINPDTYENESVICEGVGSGKYKDACLYVEGMLKRDSGIGFFPDGLVLDGTSDLDAGIYVVGEVLQVKNTADLDGSSGVSFILLEGTEVDMHNDAQLELTAPNSGTTKGVVLAAKGNVGDAEISGSLALDGELYFPNWDVTFKKVSVNSADDAKCVRLTANTLVFSGNTPFYSYCDNDPSTSSNEKSVKFLTKDDYENSATSSN